MPITLYNYKIPGCMNRCGIHVKKFYAMFVELFYIIVFLEYGLYFVLLKLFLLK